MVVRRLGQLPGRTVMIVPIPAARAAFSSPTTSETKRMSGGSSPTSSRDAPVAHGILLRSRVRVEIPVQEGRQVAG